MSSSGVRRRRPGDWLPLLLFCILFTILYLVVDRTGQITALQHNVSLWYPPAALILVVVLRLRLIGALLAAVAALIGFYISDDNGFSFLGAVLYSVGSPAGALLIRAVLRRLDYLDPRRVPRPQLAIALIAAAIAYAFWNVVLLSCVILVAPGEQSFTVADRINWFMGDAVGVTAVGGFALQILFPIMLGDIPITWRGIKRSASNFLVIFGLSMLPIAASVLDITSGGFRMAFLAAIPIFYAALFRGYAMTSLAIVCANIGFMLAAQYDAIENAMELQALALMINIGGMLTAAITTNQAAMLKALRQTLAERDKLTSERADFEKKLSESQRLDSLGRMAGGLAHEINNLLHPIKSFARSAATAPEDKRLHYLARINECADNAHQIVSDVLTFARDAGSNPTSTMKTVEAQLSVESSIAIATEGLPKAIRLVSDIQLLAARMRCDVGGVSQIMVNLINNARDAMPTGGTISIVGDVVELDEALSAQSQLEAGCFIRLQIRDDGQGMDENIARRVFEPFFTTKDMGRGTGLGLSVVYGMVRRWGGTILVESKVGIGSIFTVLIPLASEV